MRPTDVLQLARADLACYAVAQWPAFELALHHRLIVDKLEGVERGELRRLMIFLPPRHGKSLIATQLFPAWYLGRHADHSIITASYGQELADDFAERFATSLPIPCKRRSFPVFGCRMMPLLCGAST